MTEFEEQGAAGIAIVAFALLLGFAVVFFTAPEPGCVSCLNETKQLSIALHSQALERSSETLESFETGGIVDPELASALKIVSSRAEEDLEWVMAMEGGFHSSVLESGNEKKAREFFAKQVAAGTLQIYVSLLSLEVADSVERDIGIQRYAVAEAGEREKGIKQADVLETGFLQEGLEQETGITEEDVKQAFSGMMGEYLERVRGEFLAGSSPLEDFVSAERVLELDFLFQIYS